MDPWKYTGPSPEHDVSLLSDRFETVIAVNKERHTRFRNLKKGQSEEEQTLAETLEACQVGSRCKSPACPECFRRHRLVIIGGALRTFSDHKNLVFVTLVPPQTAFPETKLAQFDPKSLIMSLRKQMDRAGVKSDYAIGGIDCSHDPGHHLFQPHLHFITNVSGTDSIRAMVKKYPKDPRVRRPIDIRDIESEKGLTQTVSYCFKSHWLRLARYVDSNGKKQTRHLRLDPSMHREWLIWRDSQPFMSGAFLKGIKGGELLR